MSDGPSGIIAANIAMDTVDTTPLIVHNFNPSEYAGGLEDVDRYNYLSTQSIWLGQGTDKSLANYIVPTLGVGSSKAEGSILISTTQILESTQSAQGARADVDGAETDVIDIIVQKARNQTDDDVLQASLRIRMVIDINLRHLLKLPPDLYVRDPVTGRKFDKTIMDAWFKCFYLGQLIDQRNSIITSRYRVEYIRLFTKVK